MALPTDIHRRAALLLGMLCCLALPFALPAQAPDTANILSHARSIALHELARWQALDHFRHHLDSLPISGAITHQNAEGIATFFLSEDPMPMVLLHHQLDAQGSPGSLRTSTTPRSMTPGESFYLNLHLAIRADWDDNPHGLYILDEGTRLEVHAFPEDGIFHAYIMARPELEGHILLGRDHHLRLDREARVLSREALHQRLHVLSTTEPAEITAHIHEKGEPPILSATDIATLMLYGQFSPWLQHIAVGPGYVSTWDLQERRLRVQTRKSWDKGRRK